MADRLDDIDLVAVGHFGGEIAGQHQADFDLEPGERRRRQLERAAVADARAIDRRTGAKPVGRHDGLEQRRRLVERAHGSGLDAERRSTVERRIGDSIDIMPACTLGLDELLGEVGFGRHNGSSSIRIRYIMELSH